MTTLQTILVTVLIAMRQKNNESQLSGRYCGHGSDIFLSQG